MRTVLQPDRLGGLHLDLPEPGLLERAEVVGPDQVVPPSAEEMKAMLSPRGVKNGEPVVLISWKKS